jgi:tRNA-dihydrouridine synthase B
MLENYIREMKVGNIKLKNNVFLAPMAGVTDIPFRKICREFDPGLTFTEMASSKAMEYESEKTLKLLEIMEGEKPSAIQIFGSNKDVISNTINKLNDNEKIDIIDINMGCPAPKLVKNGDGAGLLKDLKNVEEIIKSAVKISKKVITVKTRKGFDDDHITAIEVAKMCEFYGVGMITVHGRTREEYYMGKSDLDIIKKVKEATPNFTVIGNGDVFDVKSAKNMFEYTGCDGIMVARGAQGNPWIFKSILEGREYNISNEERLSVIFKHIDYALEFEDKHIANLKLRKHIAWYLKGLDGSSKIKNKVNKSSDLNEVKSILKDYFLTLG